MANCKDMAQANMLQEIQGIEFAAVELTLFLDTHPNDQRALNDYNFYTTQLIALKKQYEQTYGPLTVFGCSPSQYPWRWIEEPWPWELDV